MTYVTLKEGCENHWLSCSIISQENSKCLQMRESPLHNVLLVKQVQIRNQTAPLVTD